MNSDEVYFLGISSLYLYTVIQKKNTHTRIHTPPHTKTKQTKQKQTNKQANKQNKEPTKKVTISAVGRIGEVGETLTY